MSKKSKKTTATKPRFKVIWPSERWESRIHVIDKQDNEIPDIDYYWRDPGMVLGMERLSEASCCGFPQLGIFECFNDTIFSKHAREIGEALRDKMVAKKVPYMVAYLPNTKEWLHYRTMLDGAGFKPTVSLKSLHGKYTNSRWEWFGPTFTPEKTDEKAVRPSVS